MGRKRGGGRKDREGEGKRKVEGGSLDAALVDTSSSSPPAPSGSRGKSHHVFCSFRCSCCRDESGAAGPSTSSTRLGGHRKKYRDLPDADDDAEHETGKGTWSLRAF